ncbi:protein-tyrosine phosphatase-like protein [Infundibulicybe gibba]|nr:protein-tyrosine phosphatase-like protein [Infundibulicybe gibba]
MAARIPSWLSRTQSPKYQSEVLQTLAERELKREQARSASRRKSGTNKPKIYDSDHYAVNIGNQPENHPRNRYYELEPYDRTRVIVESGACGKEFNGTSREAGQGRYLNASWVLERFGHKWWIAAQAPLPNTVHSFLSLILQPISQPPKSLSASAPGPPPKTSRVRTVVQLTQNVEGGRRKADEYFPSNIGQSFIVPADGGCPSPALRVTLRARKVIADARCVQSTVSILPLTTPKSPPIESGDGVASEAEEDSHGVNHDEGIEFQHLLYMSWPDHGVPEPEDRASLLAFLRLADEMNRGPPSTAQSELDPDPPIIVGCSAGIGRTGSFIALSSLLRSCGLLPAPASPCPTSALPSSPLGQLPPQFEEDLVSQEIDSLREQRPGMVQRREQVILIYEALISALQLEAPSNGQ